MPRDVGVVVVAAGRGTRFAAVDGVPKQYRPLGGVPLVLWAVRPFLAHPDVAQVALVLPPDDVREPPAFLAPVLGDRLTPVAGGAERHDSTRLGLAALGPACTVALVHDGARPFVDAATIDAVIAEARAGRGAVPAVPVSDTLKEAIGVPPVVGRTVPREGLWRAQTPQGFPRAVLAAAHARAHAEGVGGTDDAALVERLGFEIRLLADSPRNFKVTTADDFALAEFVVLQRR